MKQGWGRTGRGIAGVWDHPKGPLNDKEMKKDEQELIIGATRTAVAGGGDNKSAGGATETKKKRGKKVGEGVGDCPTTTKMEFDYRCYYSLSK